MRIEQYIKPDSIESAINEFVADKKRSRFVAGGTDVIVNHVQGNDMAEKLIDLSGINELCHISQKDGYLILGPLVTLAEIQAALEVQKEYPALVDAAHSVASPVIRMTASIGGNLLCENRCSFYNQTEWWREAVGYCLKCEGDICIATGGTKACFSRFVSDTAPVLIALNAGIELIGPNGVRKAAVEDLYTGDGLQPRKLESGEILTSIRIPFPTKFRCVFKKLRPRESVDFTSLTTAVGISDQGSVRIVIGGVDPGPVLISGKLNDGKEELISMVVKKCRIVDNDLYSRDYRKRMVKIFLEQSFRDLT